MSPLSAPCVKWTGLLVLSLLSTAAHRSAVAQPPTLAERIQPLIDEHKGQVAVAIKDMASGETFQHRGDVPMSTASLIKVAVMVEAYRQADAGKLDLSQRMTLEEEDKAPGSGILTLQFSAGMQLSVRDAIRLMIAYSDNTATNLVLDKIGLPATAAAMEELGFPNTKIHAQVFRGDTSIFPERSREFGLGSTTANEQATLLERLLQGELASEASTAAMLEHLRACTDKNQIPRLLPSGTKVAHKTGAVTAVRTAAGIIEAPHGLLILCVLTAENEDRRWTDQNDAEGLIAHIAEAAFRFYNPADESTGHAAPGELKLGSNGWLVEALQRTLNQQMFPSPNLTVDGEFGPTTQSAVIAFQKQQDLSGMGVVDAATWQALGPLLTGDELITDPAAFDLHLADKQSADPLEGTPYVTCKAWAIGNEHGETLWGGNADDRLEIASTTKLMTAWVVMQFATKDPSVLEEFVTASARAAETPGSTANLKTGEKLPVRELLFGLLLPSGNDAATAFAEHFGGRCEPAADTPQESDPLPRFAAEMNREAARLGMTRTIYRNPHGLPVRDHRSTASDLVRLASAILRDGRLLEYTQTRKHVGKLEGGAAYVRYELWTNTNRLLDTEGYLGFKTGTTTPAGACLVSLGERDGRRLIAVVLGATSSDARYTDTRNLFRWAWNQAPAEK